MSPNSYGLYVPLFATVVPFPPLFLETAAPAIPRNCYALSTTHKRQILPSPRKKKKGVMI